MTRLLLAIVVASLTLATRAAAQDAGPPPAARAPSPCAEPTAPTLLSRIPEAEREGWFAAPRPARDEEGLLHNYLESPPRVLEVELDGSAPREAVLGLSRGEQEDDSASAVFVFSCRGTAWQLIGQVEMEIDSGWYGTLDDAPGLAVMRAETIAGIDHDLLRVEHVDVRGSYDPRFVRRRFLLLHVVGGALVTALDVVVSEHYEGGPAREETSSATRTLILRPGRGARPPRYRLVTVLTEGEARERRQRCGTWLVWDGRAFVPRDAACAAR